VPIDGGSPVELTSDAAVRPSVSPDGQQIACWYSDVKPNSPQRVAIIPMSGGEPTSLLPVPPTAKLSGIIGAVWLPDGKSLSYVDSRAGVDNLWRLPLDGSAVQPITNFKSEMIESYTWSRDGKLAFSRGVITQDVMILRESR
jgi:hypothetical protein